MDLYKRGRHYSSLRMEYDDIQDRTMCRIPEAIVGKHAFIVPGDSNMSRMQPGRIATDTRDRVWKLWSRVVEKVAADQIGGGGAFFPGFLAPAMKESRHFVLPDRASTWNETTFRNALRPDGPDGFLDMVRGMFGTFILPFDVCAIHLPGEAIGIVCRLENLKDHENWDWGNKPWANGGTGLNGKWFIGTFFPVEKMDCEKDAASTHSIFECGLVNLDDDAAEASSKNGEEHIPFTVSPMMRLDLLHDGRVVALWLNGEDLGRRQSPDLSPSKGVGEFSQNIFDMMIAVQSHKRFIVEIEPETHAKRKTRKAKKGRSILPMSQRPVYLSMEPKEIRETMGLPQVEGEPGKRAPHERRAHLRMLRSERFRFKQGSLVPVKGSWIGPTKGTTNEGREYRVLIGITSPHLTGESK